VAAPAFAAGSGPLVLIDEAHQNLRTATGRYAAFAAVAAADCFRVEPAKNVLAPGPPALSSEPGDHLAAMV
jgi:hypothetical protein